MSLFGQKLSYQVEFNLKNQYKMTHTVFTPEMSRLVRTNMRLKIQALAQRYMSLKGSHTIKLCEFKSWLAREYQLGNPLVQEAQAYYVDGGFTGKSVGPWSSAPYGFWEYDRLNKWLAKCGEITMRKENNRILLSAVIFY